MKPGSIFLAALSLSALLAMASPHVLASESFVPPALDLVADGRLSRERDVPIMLVFTREECGYCDLLKEKIIVPMIISGEYGQRAIIREVQIDHGPNLRDFQGRSVSPFAVADAYDALLTPTVVFVGPGGDELADRLVGINNVDMYLWYVEKSLAEGAETVAE